MNEELINRIVELAKAYRVTKLILFGSSVDSLENANDIDLACDGLNDNRFFKFGADLENIFKKNIDLIPLMPVTPFVEYINKHGKVIYDTKAN